MPYPVFPFFKQAVSLLSVISQELVFSYSTVDNEFCLTNIKCLSDLLIEPFY